MVPVRVCQHLYRNHWTLRLKICRKTLSGDSIKSVKYLPASLRVMLPRYIPLSKILLRSGLSRHVYCTRASGFGESLPWAFRQCGLVPRRYLPCLHACSMGHVGHDTNRKDCRFGGMKFIGQRHNKSFLVVVALGPKPFLSVMATDGSSKCTKSNADSLSFRLRVDLHEQENG